MITNAIPGGNIKVLSIDGHKIELDVELRDTTTDWFYWSFQAEFPEPGDYEFRFVRPEKVGTRGPAVSTDDGKSWRWLSPVNHADNQKFTYRCDTAGKRVRFCMGMAYLQQDFDAFLREFAGNRALATEALCVSGKGRTVELATVKSGNPPDTVLLTARHHAGEMMASHALEGILRTALEDTSFGREFRERIALYAVPFVDKDGVEDGDQGKNRAPYDHARDYCQSNYRYPETGAIRDLIDRIQPKFVLDLHCPWIRGGDNNEKSYLVGTGNRKMDEALEEFAAILESEAPPEAPYEKRNNVPFGVSWNTGDNYRQGKTVKHYAATLPSVACAQTMEIPFANFGEITVDRSAMLLFGAAIARSILQYLKSKPER